MAELPKNLKFSVNALAPSLKAQPREIAFGSLEMTWDAPLDGDFDSVTISKNGDAMVTDYTDQRYVDSNWNENDYYQFEAKAIGTTPETIEIQPTIFPYYPIYPWQGAHYYAGSFQVGDEPLGTLQLGIETPVRLLKNGIRHEIELQRLAGGFLHEIKFTSSDVMFARDMHIGKNPWLSIQCIGSSHTTRSITDTETTAQFRITVYSRLNDANEELRKVENILYWLTYILEQQHSWTRITGTVDTTNIQVTYPDTSENALNNTQMTALGAIDFQIRMLLPWRD